MEQQTIGALEGIDVPLYALRAALSCASTEANQYYLNGVYVHALDDEYRVVATDGHRMLVFSLPFEGERQRGEVTVPEWAKKGVIISSEGLKDRLNLLDKLECETAHIAYQVRAPHIVISDPTDSCMFKVQPVDGTFAEYQRILDGVSFEAREQGEMASVSFDTGYLKDVGALAKMLGAKSARVFGGGGEKAGDPALITFPECPFAALILMPMRNQETRLGVGVARVMSGAVSGTVSALRAHQTRWVNRIEGAKGRVKKEAEDKVAEYEKRIAAVIAATTTVQALPAPEVRHQPEPEPEPEAEVSYAIAQAVEPEPVLPGQDDLAAYRRGLTTRATNRAVGRFYADVNAILSAEHDGLTLSRLADGVPIDDWFTAGLDAAEAATRCLDWRQIGDVLPPDEVAPGEAHLPVGLLQSPARQSAAPAEDGMTEGHKEGAWDDADLLANHIAIESIEPGSLSPEAEVEQPRPQAAAAARISNPTRRGKKLPNKKS